MTASAAFTHINVCVCTFRRPELLTRLLEALEGQVTDDRFTFSVVIIDNDRAESARHAVNSFASRSNLAIEYGVEPEQNIALARNRAIARADGDFIALIDDDEFPAREWLLGMLRALRDYKAHGVLGPVKPHFEVRPASWVVRGGFCERPSYRTGTPLREARQMRTGNCLICRDVFLGEAGPFDPRFGRTGGEDVDFFSRRLTKGDPYVWCDEAAVFESVPPNRMTRIYFLRRALLRGVVNAHSVRILSLNSAKSLAAAIIYTAMLPALLLWRHDVFMHYLIRDCDHIGKLFAICGVKLVHQRNAA